jgi:uncharacterized protein YcbK (DUF882 family)
MGDLSLHFSRSELACHHCGRLVLDTDLLQGLELLRELANAPIIIHDAYRCEVHNLEVGGVPNSEHPNGKAADLEIRGKNLNEMYQLAVQVPVFEQGGIGLYDGGFIHVDVRKKKARWARVKGKYVAMEALLS